MDVSFASALSFATQMWKVCFRKHPSSLGNKQLLHKHSQMKFCKAKGESELRWKLWSQREDSISLPLTHFQDLVFFCTFKLVPEAKFRNNTWNDVCHKTRIVQDYLIFTRFYLVVFLGIKSKQMLPFFFFSFTLLYKISCRTFFYTDLKKESVKKTLRMFLSCILFVLQS